MSHTRHAWAVVVGSVAALTLLSGCFGSNSEEPTAAHTRRHSRATEPTTPTAPTSSTTGDSSPPAGPAVLTFSPKSGGKHNDDCQRLEPGDDPAEFLYYPVLIKASTAATLTTVGTDHTQGVVDAGAWVAPAGTTPETGTFKGWPPPKIVTGDSNLEWSTRVPAKGATLQPGVFYNVFLRLQVDPTPGDSRVDGLRLTYDADGAAPGSSVEWVAHTTFSMSC